MIRAFLWTAFYIATFGTLCIDVRYTDGVTVQLHGWKCGHKKKAEQGTEK